MTIRKLVSSPHDCSRSTETEALKPFPATTSIANGAAIASPIATNAPSTFATSNIFCSA